MNITPKESITPASLSGKQLAQLNDNIERLFSSSAAPNAHNQTALETLMIHIPVRARVSRELCSWASASPRGATPLGIVPELLVRSAVEVGRTAASASFYATFPFLKLAEYTPGPWRTYTLRTLYSLTLTEEQQAQVSDGFARSREGVHRAHEKVLRTVPFGAVGVRSTTELQRDEALGKGGWWLTR